MVPDSAHAATVTGRLLVLVSVTALLAGACATTQGATPRPFPLPSPAGTGPAGSGAAAPASLHGRAPAVLGGGLRDGLIDTALNLRGIQYRWGGSDLRGFDCSGFAQYVFAQHGVTLPREVGDQYRQGRPVRLSEVRGGDLLFFTTSAPGASHVAISLGGDEFVHAPSSTGVVRIEKLSSGYWSRRLVGIKRIE